ncbi:MAG: metal ABC transporter permease [Solirubrobacteraceae bacterium]|nr:metal ABC transporter permease [Solirubrobacteraceae bacterium]
MTELVTDPLLRRALLEVVILGLACGPLGVWVLHERRAFAAESLSHGMLPGLVVASLAGAPLLLGAAGGIVIAAALVAFASRDARVGGDTAVAVVVTALFGLGVVLALRPEVPARLGEILFGDPLGATAGDLAVAAALCVGVLVALALGGRALRIAAFDPQAAPSLGVRPSRVGLGLLVVLAVTIAAAAQGLGSLLLLALLLAPSAAAIRASDRLTTQLRVAAALGAGCGVIGLEASRAFDIAAGPAIALAACAAYVVVAILRPGERTRHTSLRSAPIDGLRGSR